MKGTLIDQLNKTDLRPDFVSANDKHHFPAPRIHKTGPAGIQYDIISILSTKSNGQMFKRGLASKFQDWKKK